MQTEFVKAPLGTMLSRTGSGGIDYSGTSVDSSRMSKNMTIYGHEEFKRRRVPVIYVWRAVLVQPAGFVYLYTVTATYIALLSSFLLIRPRIPDLSHFPEI